MREMHHAGIGVDQAGNKVIAAYVVTKILAGIGKKNGNMMIGRSGKVQPNPPSTPNTAPDAPTVGPAAVPGRTA